MTESQLLEIAAGKRALFAGESILDRYIYCRPLGKASKDCALSVEKLREETFLGGVDAAVTHAKALCPSVTVRYGGALYRKTRLVESQHVRKMFEVYECMRLPTLPDAGDLHLYDVVVLFDYGHGAFQVGKLEPWRSASYLAVNVQTNSGNYGYNLATKWDSCDYLCVDEAEARLATGNRDGPIEDSIGQLAPRAEKLVITRGKDGAVGFDQQSGLTYCPAFTDRVVDTMGCGDAFFAVTALVARDAPMYELLRLGNAAGALKAQTVGHRQGITKDGLAGILGCA